MHIQTSRIMACMYRGFDRGGGMILKCVAEINREDFYKTNDAGKWNYILEKMDELTCQQNELFRRVVFERLGPKDIIDIIVDRLTEDDDEEDY